MAMKDTPDALIKSIFLPEATIYWLSVNTDIPIPVLEKRVHPLEMNQASLMRSRTRREEYLRTRFLLHKLILTNDPILRQTNGVPSWPEGILGSITHKNGSIGVAFDASQTLYGLGIDAEELSVKSELESRIVTPHEAKILLPFLENINSLSTTNDCRDINPCLALAFSFKEALFKACFPNGQIKFYFLDAEIIGLDLNTSQLTARLCKDVGPLTPKGCILSGHFCLHKEQSKTGKANVFVLTAIRIAK